MLTVASALAALGAALAWMTPFTPTVAAAMALAIAFAGHLGCIVLAAQRRDQSPAARGAILARIVVRPDALAFAAPVFYHATRTWLTW
jgi:predicted CDP-diglyceride synthetase/phosphatidate cytidylyltransferase